MKFFLANITFSIILSSFFCLNGFASKKEVNSVIEKNGNIRELSSLVPNDEVGPPKPLKAPSKFNLKTTFTNPNKFEAFVTETLSILEIDSPKTIGTMISKGSENIFLHSYLKETPLISEFLYQLFNKPQVISKFLGIFVQRNSILIFAMALILSIIFSYYLGEFKYKFPALSFKRIAYSGFRFFSVNVFRVWIFSFLFVDNIKPITHIYIKSVASVKHVHPTLYDVTNIITQYI